MGRWVDIKPQTTIILKFLFLNKKNIIYFVFKLESISGVQKNEQQKEEKTYILENSGK